MLVRHSRLGVLLMTLINPNRLWLDFRPTLLQSFGVVLSGAQELVGRVEPPSRRGLKRHQEEVQGGNLHSRIYRADPSSSP